MAAIQSPFLYRAELPIHSADDASSRQQKMAQQRQLALKRQRDSNKVCNLERGVTAQLDTPCQTAGLQNNTVAWGKVLECMPLANEKLPWHGPDAGPRFVVPLVDEQSCGSFPSLMSAAMTNQAFESLQTHLHRVESGCVEAVVQDTNAMFQTDMEKQKSTEQHVASIMHAMIMSEADVEESDMRISRLRQSAKVNDGGVSVEVQPQEKSRRPIRWRPWAATKRLQAETSQQAEAIMEETHEASSPAHAGGPLHRNVDRVRVAGQVWHIANSSAEETVDRRSLLSRARAAAPWNSRTVVPREIIVEERRVAISPQHAEENQHSRSIHRAATPWQTPDEVVVEDCFGSCPPPTLDDDAQEQSSAAGNFPGEHDLHQVGQCGVPMRNCEEDDELRCIENILMQNMPVQIEKDHDSESIDSGIETRVNEWKMQEKQSPKEKRSRLARFIPTAPKLWRTSKVEVFLEPEVTHTLVTPLDSIEID